MKCEHCGKEYDENEFDAEVYGDVTENDYDHVCYDCADEFLSKGKDDIEVSHKYDVFHKCYLCGEICIESEMKMEGEVDPDWMCNDCIDSCISSGEHVVIHYN